MARTLQDAKLDTRAARLRLKERREPYWRSISEGLGIGYRKGLKGGTWIARHYSGEDGRRFQSLGTSDDIADADGMHILSFSQAQEAARKWLNDLAREDSGDVKVGSYRMREAMSDYLSDYSRRGGRGLYVFKTIINAHIMPSLGDLLVTRLTRKRIEAWHDALASKPPRVRSKKGEEQQYRAASQDEDALRRRRSTANRVLTILKAALNHAYQRGHVANRDTWNAVKPFRHVDSARIRYLNDKECLRLANVCPEDLRDLVTAALLTGARYGELAALRVLEVNSDSGTIQIARSKSGKSRHIVLTDEGRIFFKQAVIGKKGDDLIFMRSTGAKWRHADQYRQMKEACQKAKIIPAIGFHILRHTYASRLAMKGVPMPVIATQLGHSDTRMTEKHYAHLAPSYVADTIRAAFGEMGIVKLGNIVPLER
jgi:integrase